MIHDDLPKTLADSPGDIDHRTGIRVPKRRGQGAGLHARNERYADAGAVHGSDNQLRFYDVGKLDVSHALAGLAVGTGTVPNLWYGFGSDKGRKTNGEALPTEAALKFALARFQAFTFVRWWLLRVNAHSEDGSTGSCARLFAMVPGARFTLTGRPV